MKYPETLTDEVLEIIWNCVEMCHAAYESTQEFEYLPLFKQYDDFWFVRGLGASLCVVLETPSRIYVAFRGTVLDSVTQIKSDISTHWIVEPSIGNVSTGVRQELDHIWPCLLQKVEELLYKKPRALYVTGHSLGGGMASLATARFLLHGIRKAELVFVPSGLLLFGAIRVGNSEYVQHIENLEIVASHDDSRIGIWRFKNGVDFITMFPPKIWGYASEGKTMYITPSGDFHLEPWSVKRLWWEFKGSYCWFRMLSRGLYDHRISQYKHKIEKLVEHRNTRTQEVKP